MTSRFDVSRSLREAQFRSGSSNGDIAKHFNICPQQVCRWRHGETDMKFSRVVDLAGFFNMDLIQFLEMGKSNDSE